MTIGERTLRSLPFLADRTTAFALIGVVVAVNGLAGKLADSVHSETLADAILSLGGVSAIIWCALIVIAIIVWQCREGRSPTRQDYRLMPALLLVALVPFNVASSLALVATGTYLIVSSASRSSCHRIGIIMLALSGPLLWGHLLLAFFGPALLSIDAQLAAALAGTAVHGNVVDLQGQQGSLYVALGCSSLHNMSLAILLFAVVTQLVGLPISAPLVLGCLGSVSAMAMVNISRLATIASNPDQFDYYHLGQGASLFGLASFIAAGAVTGLSVVAATARR